MPKPRRAAFSGTSEHGDVCRVYLCEFKPWGELEVTLANGRKWTTQIDLTEIAIFGSGNRFAMSLYMDEMLKNARAGSEPRH